MNKYSRRNFLHLGMRTIAGAGLALGANPQIGLANTQRLFADAADDSYRALVCVFLEGGIDGFSLFVPNSTAEHNAFARSRGNLAVDRSSLLDMGVGTGLHSSASALMPLWDAGKLAMISNVGNLVEPTTREDYLASRVDIPVQLFSHADQAQQWQQLQGRNRSNNGWGALAAGHLTQAQARDYLTSISVAGSNHWLTSHASRPYTLRESGLVPYIGLNESNVNQRPRASAFNDIMQIQGDSLLQEAYSDLQQNARSNTAEIGSLLSARFPSGQEPISHNPAKNIFAARLNMVAKLIAIQSELGMRRQLFYVRLGGFDVHDDQNDRLPQLFAKVADTLADFQGALDALGYGEKVTTFTASDFGRSLVSNGDGTDHGWGNHLFAMGGAVRGGEVYGTLPLLDVSGSDSVHNGRICPRSQRHNMQQRCCVGSGWMRVS